MMSLIPWKRSDIQRNEDLQATPISRLRWDWDRLFDRFLDDFWSTSTTPAHGMPLDVSETDEEIRVRAEVPGIAPKDLDISLAGEVLTLSAKKLDEEDSRNGGRYYSERQFGAYERAVRLPCPVDPDHISAEHENGVVTITLQKAETVRPKRIQVKAK